jgi:Tol biopolymer transport system component
VEPERWRRVEELYNRVLELEPGRRGKWLDDSCGDDAALRGEVESLLAHDKKAEAGHFIESPALEMLGKRFANELETADGEAKLIGRTVSHYRVLEKLGVGGMGVVYKAEDTRLHRFVALKFLPDNVATDPQWLSRFRREAEAASALSHPNICTVYDIGEHERNAFIVMEFLDGATLKHLIAGKPLARVIQRGPLPLRKLIDVSTQICDGLAAAHTAGVVHRDLKPGNIMLTRDGRVKILDFGLARQVHAPGSDSTTIEASHPGVIMGTPGYMSPEQVRGESTDARSDIFSLGVILYEMASGKRAFTGGSSVEVMNSILKDEPPELPPASPPALDRIVRRCIEKQPTTRFQSASDLGFALNAITTSNLTAVKRGRKLLGKRAVLAGAAIVVAIAGAYLWTTWQTTPRVTNIVRITQDGKSKGWMVADGTRLYYTVDAFGNEAFQISATGGEPVKMPSLDGMFFDDISPNGSELLLRHTTLTVGAPLWAAPVLGGSARRLGDLRTTTRAAWSPQGDRIVYVKGREIWVARSDGTESMLLATLQGPVYSPRWSPDGRTIRFTLLTRPRASLWDISADGSHLHALLPEWADHWAAEGRWTSDGRYFLFEGGKEDDVDLWALREKSGLPGPAPRPVRLTAGPLVTVSPIPSPDGRRIFFIGRLDSGEFIRYDLKSAQWLSYLPGISATRLSYSHDGKWLAYVSFPGGALWRSDTEGGQGQQLTSAPLLIGGSVPWLPKAILVEAGVRWSPDDKQIAIAGAPPGKAMRLYIVASAGGPARQLATGESGDQNDTSPYWSPDGASLVFSRSYPRGGGEAQLMVVEVSTGRTSVLPGSQGLFSPRYSPDGRSIAAIEASGGHLILYDVGTRQRTDLSPDLTGDYPCWSRDGQFIYFEYNYHGGNGSGFEICRVRVRDRKLERLANLKGVRFPQAAAGWFGLAPDDSLLSIRDTGGTDICRLDWDAP